MRELAVRKLSEAYHLDEIAASVATMQSASSLDDVAKAVLQRAPNDVHAKYVNFFHEKIPSRALAESTSLLPLNEILRESSIDSATLRTRAITKVLKEDYDGAIKDLTEALNSVPRDNIQHLDRGSSNNARNETVVSCHVTRDAKHYKQRLNDDQKPTGMEAQLHFQRATVQLGLACQSVEAVLKVKWPSQQESTENTSIDSDTRFHQSLPAYQKVKLNTKRALRDLTFFLSKLEYSPGLAIKVGGTVPAAPSDKGLLQGSNNSSDHIQLEPSIKTSVTAGKTTNLDSENPSARIYQISNLFSTTPPTDLPPFPSTLSNPHEPESSKNSQTNQVMSTIRSERVTYHPLLSEALHGLLLCHSLLQTDTSTIHKYAYMVARLVSLSDGLPIFLSSRSASRADWTDILFETKDWLKLDHSWDHLCQSSRTSRERRSKLPSQPANHQNETTGNSTKSPDNDGDSNDETPSSKLPSAKQQNHHPDLKAYSLGTDRAAIIKRWIMEAPHLPDASVNPRKGKKKGGGGGAP